VPEAQNVKANKMAAVILIIWILPFRGYALPRGKYAIPLYGTAKLEPLSASFVPATGQTENERQPVLFVIKDAIENKSIVDGISIGRLAT
jgi:hypothetical protein